MLARADMEECALPERFAHLEVASIMYAGRVPVHALHCREAGWGHEGCRMYCDRFFGIHTMERFEIIDN